MKPSFDPYISSIKETEFSDFLIPLYWQHVKGLHNQVAKICIRKLRFVAKILFFRQLPNLRKYIFLLWINSLG